jgi:hypothetical protein
MNFKILVKSKTFWTGVASVLGGVAQCLSGDVNSGFQLIATGLSVRLRWH